MAPKRQSISSVYPAPEQARRNWSRKSMVGARKRGILRFLRAQKGKEILKHSQTTYVDELQLTTLLIPLLSAGCYPDGNSPGKYHGK
jgi:hypothetical protein